MSGTATPVIIKRRPVKPETDEQIDAERLSGDRDQYNETEEVAHDQTPHEEEEYIDEPAEEREDAYDEAPSPDSDQAQEEQEEHGEYEEAEEPVEEEYEHQDEAAPHEDDYEQEQEHDGPRDTAAPGESQPHLGLSDDAAVQAVAAEEREHMEAVPYVANEDPVPAVMKTARPHAPKEKKPKAGKKAGKKTAGKATAEQVVAKPAPIPAPSSAARKKKGKKPTHKVSLLNVEKIKPVPEGVNTPRSVALCEEYGINPSELRPRTFEEFHAPNVSSELADLRYHSYEKRRTAHMAALLPLRKQEEVDEKEEEAVEEEEERRAAANTVTENGAVDAETLEMQRQFEEQHNRILEQERRQAAASGNKGGSSPHVNGRSSSYAGSSPRYNHNSVGRNSVIGMPASATKIQSRCKVENRVPNEAERVIMEEIIERDQYGQEIRDRQEILEENRKLMLVEQRLAKEKEAAGRIEDRADRLQKEVQRRTKERAQRQTVAEDRRWQMEAERQRKIEDDLADKEARIHASDPYTSVMSRRRYSSSARFSRRSSGRRPTGVQPGDSTPHASSGLPVAVPPPAAEEAL